MGGLIPWQGQDITRWLRTGQVARRLDATGAYVNGLIRRGQLVAVRTPLGYLVEPESVEAFLADRERRRQEREQRTQQREQEQAKPPTAPDSVEPQADSGPASVAERRAGRNGGVHSPMTRSRTRSGVTRTVSNGHDEVSLWASAPAMTVSATGTMGRSV